MCNTALMPAKSTCISAITEVDEFVAMVSAQRIDDGEADHITDPSLYRVLDGIMAGVEHVNFGH